MFSHTRYPVTDEVVCTDNGFFEQMIALELSAILTTDGITEERRQQLIQEHMETFKEDYDDIETKAFIKEILRDEFGVVPDFI